MPPNGNAGLTRSLILKSATHIISQDGLSALTAGRLIQIADISKGGLYHHFRTMSDVEFEVLELLLQNIYIELAASPSPRTVEDFFNLIEQEIFEKFAVNSEFSRALFAFTSVSATNERVKGALSQFMDDLSSLRLKRLQAVSPTISPVILHNAMQLITTVQLGLTCRFFSGVDSISLRNYWKGLRILLVSAINHDEAQGLHDLVGEALPSLNVFGKC
jgi:AcrR family transcriptional regulator